MATAREKLLQTLSAIVSEPFSEEGRLALKRLLNSYRVQLKPGCDLGTNDTARDGLAHNIVTSWKEKAIDKKTLKMLITPFRMQLKTSLIRNQASEQVGDNLKESSQNLPSLPKRTQIRENVLKHENAYFRNKSTSENHNTSIAGGPRQKNSSRGQCPKCKSSGLVLARSYGGENYHTCIYCGYQSYPDSADPNLDLPLAAELLGHTFNGPDFDNED